MEQAGVDCLVGTSLQNVLYLTGFNSFLKQVTPSTLVFGIFFDSKSSEAKLVTSYSEGDIVAASETKAEDVELYGTFPLELSKKHVGYREKRLYELCSRPTAAEGTVALASLLEKFGLDSSTIALDETGLPFGVFDRIKALLPKAKIIPGSRILSSIRMVKTEEEIQKIREVVSLTENAIKKSVSFVKPGENTLEISKQIERIEYQASAKPIFTVVASGGYRAFPNAPPSTERLSNSDVVRFDVGCNLSGYCSDLGRTLAVGSVDRKTRNYYEATLRGLEVAIDNAVPGAKASELFRLATETVSKNGIKHYRRHHTGHGIGLEVYDPPSISPTDSTVLEEGMVLNLETPYYELGFTGLIVEDCMVIRKRHPELLSKLPRELDAF
jgi:Xaa-Pro aminopeptidase